MFREMLRIRMIEEEIARRYPEGKMRTPVHLSIGQEAAAVGVCKALGPHDQCVSSHRSHAHYLAKGGSLKAMIAELYGKDTGCARGHGGSMHLIDRSVGFMGSTSIVSGTIPVGIGLAWAKKLRGEPGRVIIFHGDAAVEEGVWHESVNFAVLHKLPVVFVCENNGHSCYTPIELRQPNRSISDLADVHGLNCFENDGDVNEILEDTKSALRMTPAFIEIHVERYYEHCGPTQEVKYPPTEQDPEIMAEIEEAFKFAEESPWPEAVGMYAD